MLFNKRVPVFELQDFSWLPSQIRDGVTDYLAFCLDILNIYTPVSPLIMNTLINAKTNTIIDLASGSGGPIKKLATEIRTSGMELNVILTDLYPNKVEINDNTTQYYSRSVDARNIPSDLRGMRTLFTSFHHFNDTDAKGIIRDSCQNNAPIGIFEFTSRDLLTFCLCFPTAFLMPFFTPLIRPYKFSRLFFTYIIPLIPLVTFWDILASVLRTRSEAELKEIVKNENHYDWRIGTLKTSLFFKVIYLIGTPKLEDN